MPTCEFLHLVDAHFALSISASGEQRLRAHLPGCATCTQRYERQHLLSRALPNAPSSEDRLGAALGFSPLPPRVSPWRWAGALLPIAALALALVLWPSPGVGPDSYTARGGDAGTLAWLEVYRLAPGKPPEPSPPRLLADDALAFAYRNPDAHPFFMLFGLDARKRVHWYYPAWADAAANPSAVALEKGHVLRELPAAITHPLAPGPLQLHALFLDGPRTVRQVEAQLERGQALTSPGERALSIDLEVTP